MSGDEQLLNFLKWRIIGSDRKVFVRGTGFSHLNVAPLLTLFARLAIKDSFE